MVNWCVSRLLNQKKDIANCMDASYYLQHLTKWEIWYVLDFIMLEPR